MFYSKTIEGVTIEFNRPDVSKIDRYLRTAQKGVTKASQQLCLDTVAEGSRDEWIKFTVDKPGRAVNVSNDMLEALGFSGDEGD